MVAVWKALAIIGVGFVAAHKNSTSGNAAVKIGVTITAPAFFTAITPSSKTTSESAPRYPRPSVNNETVSAASVLLPSSHSFSASAVENSSTSPAEQTEGVKYAFVNVNGTTSWLGGKVPPSTVKLSIKTQVINIEPMPESSTTYPQTSLPTASKPPRSTVHITKDLTATVYKPSAAALSSKNKWLGHGPAGWNATIYSKASVPSASSVPTEISALDKKLNLSGTAYPEANATAKLKRRLHDRAEGNMIFANIDGAVVSWTNTYLLRSSISSFSSSILVPTLALTAMSSFAHASPDSSSTSSPLLSSSATHASVTLAPLEIASCSGLPAAFTVNFDDLPHFTVKSNSSNSSIPSIMNPYRKLYWENHFGYVPPPSDPFPPTSPPQLAVYKGNGEVEQTSPDAGLEYPGEIGAGPRSPDNAYWIDAHSAWIGCADGGHAGCQLVINGYKRNNLTSPAVQSLTLPPCPNLKGCKLTFVQFHEDFKALSGFQIFAEIDDHPVDYYMDDLKLSWSNSSCAAAQKRASAE